MLLLYEHYPPASEASREVENFDWRKKHPPTRIWCQKFVTLSVCLSVRFLTLNIDSHEAHDPPLGQAILYISPVDVLALYLSS